MKGNKSNNILVAILLFLMALTTLVFLKFFSPEDTWLCSDGQWVRHGNPSSEMPTDECR